MMSDPRTSVGGLIGFLDFSNVTSRQTIKDPNIIKNMVRFFQVCIYHSRYQFNFTTLQPDNVVFPRYRKAYLDE